jgi:hypothetical protein
VRKMGLAAALPSGALVGPLYGADEYTIRSTKLSIYDGRRRGCVVRGLCMRHQGIILFRALPESPLHSAENASCR